MRRLRRFLPIVGAKLRRRIKDYELIAGSGLFDPDWYLATYPDVSRSGMDALSHYLAFGGTEDRAPSQAFNARQYLAAHPELAATGANPLVHFLRHGEGRALMQARAEQANEPAGRFWFYIGDTLDWLETHDHLTGVGKVSMELFLASRKGPQDCIPCVMGGSPSGLIEEKRPEALRGLAKHLGLPADALLPAMEDPAQGAFRTPQPGDHVFFTGLIWAAPFIGLFRKLSSQGVTFSVLINDIIPIERPDLVGDAYATSFEEWLGTVVQTADVIFVSTPFVRDQILRWAALARLESKAVLELVTYGQRALEPRSDALMTRGPRAAKVSTDGFVLCVGTIDRRKNQLFLCRIWHELVARLGAERVPQLVLAGRDDLGLAGQDPALAELFASGKILVAEGLSDAEVAGLYGACLFSAFPSISEGYGLPVAESLLYGKLCLASDLPVVRAHAGDLIWYFPPDDLGVAVDLFRHAILEPEARDLGTAALKQGYRRPEWRGTLETMVAGGFRAQQAASLRFAHHTQKLSVPGAPDIVPGPVLMPAARWCSQTRPAVSILIVNRDDVPWTLECIRQIWTHTRNRTYEIIIADNGSDPDALAPLRRLGAGVRLLEIGCDRFRGEALNIAAEAATGRFLCLLDNRAWVQPEWLEALVSAAETDAAVGVVRPALLAPNGGKAAERHGTEAQDRLSELLPEGWDGTASAPALLLSRDLFLEAGGFDLSYEPIYCEDADLFLKVRALGRTLLDNPQARVVIPEGKAGSEPDADARDSLLATLNREKLRARWQAAPDVADGHSSTAPDHPPSQTETAGTEAPTAFLYTPYALTPGGGERYLLELANALSDQYQVTVVTRHRYSRLRLLNLGRELKVDLSRLKLASEEEFLAGPSPDLMVAMGNHIIPPVAARGKTCIFLCQFPFRQNGVPTGAEMQRLAGYGTIAVYSLYAATHIYAALRELKLRPPTVRILAPPVPLLHAGEREKKRHILTVGRFFVGGHSKRHDVLIEAFKSICHRFSEPVEFHLAGSVTPDTTNLDYLAQLQAAAQGYPIHFHVNCSAEELNGLYADATVYWHGTGLGVDLAEEPGRAEHFGISVVEAMSAGAIPCALDVGGPAEIITHGKTGFLYNSPDGLARLTQEIFSPDAAEPMQQMMRAARTRAHDFSGEAFARNVAHLVKDVTGTRS
ncbi:hypothetical protein GCM10007301_24420 [Azorhizobium oxalatiphilum]|uniref:Glycosyltransferase n=1 Tax=Azorhizobium oxalatiphilum TaxID=980631 RepID=A0A917BZ02_9HYPH|nr:glycosyltransferase [Azorhizobium oxalatiphilum]GGF63744.1 hypothetical protein GCM10007301_24420 [Azorhizobium oxalatiphilum]